jgi:hypothetical protein
VRSTYHEAPHYVVFSTPLFPRPYILLNTLLSKTFSLRSSLNVSDQVPHPYKTIDKIEVHATLTSHITITNIVKERQLAIMDQVYIFRAIMALQNDKYL